MPLPVRHDEVLVVVVSDAKEPALFEHILFEAQVVAPAEPMSRFFEIQFFHALLSFSTSRRRQEGDGDAASVEHAAGRCVNGRGFRHVVE
jgi:hypothetical protein